MNKTPKELSWYYGEKLRDMIMFSAREILDMKNVQLELVKCAELANFYTLISGVNQISREELNNE